MAKKMAKRAVSPVLATLMMVAVAVAMSVIIFTWSQGFLSQTGEAASGQQAQQNIAAQSGILIESATFSETTTKLYVRNVGTATVSIDSAQVTIRSGSTTTTEVLTGNKVQGGSSITPRTLQEVTLTTSTSIRSGDVVTIKLITTAGTFAQATFTVP